MGDYKKNPRRPFETRCPNRIRKRIIMARQQDRRDEPVVSAGASRIKSMFIKAMLRGRK